MNGTQKGVENMSITSLVIQKLKAFRMSIPSLILLLLASYRTLTSGDSIVLVGVCASIVPFMCQFRNFPKSADGTSIFKDVLSNYILNLILMAVYLAYVLILTFVGRTFLPIYVPNPYFADLLLIAVCANVVFISAVIPVCHDLKPFQRLIPGIVLTNGALVFMMMAREYVQTVDIGNLKMICCGFVVLVIALTLGFMKMCYTEKRK